MLALNSMPKTCTKGFLTSPLTSYIRTESKAKGIRRRGVGKEKGYRGQRENIEMKVVPLADELPD